jgi:hypothetical protein
LAEELAERLKGIGGVSVAVFHRSSSDEGPRLPRWLYPGMHLKRWLLLLFFGITVLASARRSSSSTGTAACPTTRSSSS